eukprot:scaffold85724_cov50-Attheya_sp.AAC.12
MADTSCSLQYPGYVRYGRSQTNQDLTDLDLVEHSTYTSAYQNPCKLEKGLSQSVEGVELTSSSSHHR